MLDMLPGLSMYHAVRMFLVPLKPEALLGLLMLASINCSGFVKLVGHCPSGSSVEEITAWEYLRSVILMDGLGYELHAPIPCCRAGTILSMNGPREGLPASWEQRLQRRGVRQILSGSERATQDAELAQRQVPKDMVVDCSGALDYA